MRGVQYVGNPVLSEKITYTKGKCTENKKQCFNGCQNTADRLDFICPNIVYLN